MISIFSYAVKFGVAYSDRVQTESAMFIVPVILLLNAAEAVEYAEVLPIPVMLQEADNAVHGRVMEKVPEWGNDGLIYTRVTMTTDNQLSSERSTKAVSFLVPGGQLDDVVLTVPGAPTFEVGKDYLVFLQDDRLFGMGQGVFQSDGSVVRRLLNPAGEVISPQHILGSPTEAKGCSAERLLSAYEDGWSLRGNTAMRMGEGTSRAMEVTLFAGLKYSVSVCGDGSTQELAIEVVDGENRVLEASDSEGVVDFTVPKTGQYWIVSQIGELDRGWTSAVDISLRYR